MTRNRVKLENSYFDNLNLLRQKLVGILNKLFTEYKEDDVRILTIFDIELTITSVLPILILLERWHEDELTGNHNVSSLLGIVVDNTIEPMRQLEDYFVRIDRAHRLIFLTELYKIIDITYFKIDNCISHINDELKIKKKDSLKFNLEELYYKIVGSRDIPDSLLCLMYTRNTLHSDLLHQKENKLFSINDFKFEFKKGELIKLNYNEITLLLELVVDELVRLYTNPLVKSILHIRSKSIQALGGFIN